MKLFFLVINLCFVVTVEAAAPVLQISLAPQATLQTVFNFSNPSNPNWVRCGDINTADFSHDFPDNPIRPFMGADGNVWLWASNSAALCSENDALSPACYGSYIKEANADISGPAPGVNQCHVGFQYTPVTPTISPPPTEEQSLASLNNLHWLLEFWVQGVGRSFQAMAVIQNDFHGQELDNCQGNLNVCRYTNLVSGSWNNVQGQFTVPFTSVSNGGVTEDYITSPLFVTPYLYYPLIGQQGVNAQTNILYVKNVGDRIPYYYILINEAIPEPYPNPTTVTSGLCLFRSNNVYDPNSWLGWNASTRTFSVKFNVNPYTTAINSPQSCSFVLPSQYRYSLAYDPQYKTFIAVGVAAANEAAESKVIYATTQDLTNWGSYPVPPYLNSAIIWQNSDTPSYVEYQIWTDSSVDSGTYGEGYFGLIDPTSSAISRTYFGQSDSNFQYVGRNPYLYMVYFNPKTNPSLGGDTLKDVDRLALQITCVANCSGY